MLNGKTILLGVTGGIAAYKAAMICSKLVQRGADVHVIMTESATRFITPLTLQTLSRNAVHLDTFDERDPSVVTHINLADRADLIIVAPATANTIAKMAHGFADDMLTTTLLAATAPIIVAPAMNVHMYEHPSVQSNMNLLGSRGVRFLDPGTGQLACGYVAKGRLAEPEEIIQAAEDWFSRQQSLIGKRVLITAGGTMERLDPVRFLTNDSSGKMGFALAEAARDRGAEVIVVAGRVTAPLPAGVQVVRIESAAEMLNEVEKRYENSSIVIKAAAVADYRPIHTHEHKMKKSSEQFTLELERTTDILQQLGERKTHQFLVGFAAETDNIDAYAMDKLKRKNCDLLVANDVSQEGAGFNGDTNAVRVFAASGLVREFGQASKRDIAEQLLTVIVERLHLKETTGDSSV